MGGLFNWQVGGLCAFNNSIHKERSAAREIRRSGRIGHQAAVLNLLAKDEHGWQAAVCTENLNPDVMVMESAEDGARLYTSGPLNRANSRRVFVQ
jgi:hypothetical protein